MYTGHGKRAAFLTVSLLLSACGGGGGGGTVPTGTPLPKFTKWSNVLPGSTVQVDGLGQEVSGTYGTGGGFTDVKLLSPASINYSAILTFDQALELTRLTLKSPSTLMSFDRAVFTDLTLAPGSTPQFVGAGSAVTGNAVILANPMNLGWEYQSFGIWETASTDGNGKTFGAMSVGAPTVGTAIPTTGTATTFTGYATGSYVSAAGLGSTALAELKVVADFVNRSLNFSTTNTRTSTNWVAFTQNDGLNLTGTLTYARGTNSFTTTTDAPLQTLDGRLTGSSTGQFYGPKAEELGGVFFLKSSDPNSVETYAGAYGAVQPTAP